MAKKDNHTELDDIRFIVEDTKDTSGNKPDEASVSATKEHLSAKLKQKINQTSEADEAPSGSLRLRDVLGGDFLWTLVRRQIWLIILIVFIITAYVAVRYQCQQDDIDIAQLEKDLVGAKFESLSSSSNLTEMSRLSNMTELMQNGDTIHLHRSNQPPYIIDVPAEK